MFPERIFGSPRMFGIETEFFLIDHEGNISNSAKGFIEDVKNKLTDSSITKECGQAMIEHITFPHTSAKVSFDNFFRDFETLLYELESKNLGIFNFGTYPGKNNGLFRDDERYKIKEKILGKEPWAVANKCIGFHYHTTLPRKSFNPAMKFFFPDLNDKTKESVLDLFNFNIAMDPAITSLMQSSPYFESKLIGKDARTLLYRGDPPFKAVSLYENYPEFGTLNEYASNYEELIARIRARTASWKELLKKEGATLSDFSKKDSFPSMLDSSWKPVKISPHGTMEYRGSDMNSLGRILGLSSALKYVLKHIQKSSVRIVPCEEGNKTPFVEEKEELFVPEFNRIKELEKESALHGFESVEVHKYASNFLKYAKKIMPDEEERIIKVFQNSIDEKKTMSDEIIDFVKKRQGDFSIIDDETAKEFALKAHDRIFRDLALTQKLCEPHSEGIFRLPKVEIVWD